MRRIADILEDESRTVDLEQGDFERLLARRERKQRNRRIRAGSVGVIVALAVGIALVRSLTADPIAVDPPVVPPPPPAASGTLTYILDGDIFVADPDGSDAVKIANGLSDNECGRGSVGEAYWAEGTMWSPDGRYIAYRHTECSDPEFRGGVEISDAEGNVITTFPTGAGWDIAWSPDSRRVAVWDSFGDTIGIYGVDGVRQTQLTMPAGWTPSGDHDPVWMPDGTSVWIDGWALPVDGSTPRRLPLGNDPYPTFSPDGSLVAYSDTRSLMVARSDGSEPREVFGGWAEHSVWSPTSDRIAFSDGEALRLLDVATGEVTRLTEEERGTDLRVMGFSPEGDRVLYSTIESDSLSSIGVDGSDASVVVPGTWQGEWLSTTADARPVPVASGALAYALDGDIYVADPDGSNAVRIADGLSDKDCDDNAAGESYWAEGSMWSPDGRYLAYRGADCDGLQEGAWSDVVIISDAEGNIVASFPADGWDIGWSPDSTRVAVWDSLDETVGVYGVDGVRQAQITMPSGWEAVGDHDPAWLRDGTLAVDAVELPLDGGAARPLDKARAAEWREDYLVTIGQRAFSPDGTHTAYGKGRSLMLEGSDGSGSVTLLTVEPGAFPSVIGFSPEGNRILFSKDGDGQGSGQRRELWSIGVDGSDTRLVVAGTVQGEWFVPSVAPDDIPAAPAGSGALAYVLDGDVYVADPDGSNAVKIANGRPEEDCAGIGEYWAEGTMWSPDGRYLAYRYSDCSDPEAVGRDVVISDADGNVLTTFPAQGWDIAWSPDSTRVAVWDRFYDPPSTIGVYGVDGARQTQLTMPSGWTPSGDRDPVWMPDGTSLWVENVEVPLDGSTPQRLPQEAPRSDPDAISPDGTRVAYDEHGSLVVAAADGSDAREVSGQTVLDPVWSPAGDRIAFIYSEKNVYKSNELRVLDVATGEVRRLAGMGGSVEIWNIQFSPEGDRILFARTEDRGAGESSLWSIGVDGSDARLVAAGTFQGDWLAR